MVNESNVAIITTVANQELYKKSIQTFPEGIDRIAIDGSNGLYGLNSILYMLKRLKKCNYKWIVMVDEDAFFLNGKAIMDLIKFMSKNNYHVSGVRDGGVIEHRQFNPFVVNSFFTVLNYKKIKSIFKREHIKNTEKLILSKNNYNELKLKYLFSTDLKRLDEPYYKFFFWLLNNKFNFLYLESKTYYNDPVANIVYDHMGNDLLVHSWYAREYGINNFHTKRINKIVNSLSNLPQKREYVLWKDNSFYYKKILKRIINKLKKS